MSQNKIDMYHKISPPLLAKEGYYSSLWRLFPAAGRQREVRRDFIKQCRHYFETVDKSQNQVPPSPLGCESYRLF